jgi:hypothetical protein
MKRIPPHLDRRHEPGTVESMIAGNAPQAFQCGFRADCRLTSIPAYLALIDRETAAILPTDKLRPQVYELGFLPE